MGTRRVRGRPRPAERGRRRVAVGWTAAAAIWDDFVESGKDWSRTRVHGPALLQAVGPVRDLAVLDVGCGQGFVSRALARRGAQVTAIDRSPAMIRWALAHGGPRGRAIEYRVLDARRIRSTPSLGRFDVVVAGMSLMDMPGLEGVLEGIHGALRPRGRFVFSITHPFNTAPVSRWSRPGGTGHHGPRIIDRYFDEGRARFDWTQPRLLGPFRVDYWHRTLGRWFDALGRSGFVVDRLVEPRPTEAQVRQHPGLDGPRRFPFWLVLACHRGATARPSRRGKVHLGGSVSRARRERPR